VRIRYGPGEKSVMHEHPAGVVVNLTDGSVKFTFPDDTTEEQSWKAGEAVWAPAGTHLPENTSDHPIEVILVEMKQPAPGSVTLHRTAQVKQGKNEAAVAWAREITAYVNEHFPGHSVRTYSETFGDLGTIHWLVNYESLAAYEEVVAMISADAGYQALIEKIFEGDLFVDGSVKDEVLSVL